MTKLAKTTLLTTSILVAAICNTTCGTPLNAQSSQHIDGMKHVEGMTHSTSGEENGAKLSSGQAAFGTISEIVALLKADPSTDWSKVNIEALRQHLVDMDNVTMRSRIVTKEVPGGFSADITGSGATVESIRKMTGAHSRQVNGEGEIVATVTEISGGARMMVVSVTPDNAVAVARLRGLGAIGILTVGNHHAQHHLAMARGIMVH